MYLMMAIERPGVCTWHTNNFIIQDLMKGVFYCYYRKKINFDRCSNKFLIMNMYTLVLCIEISGMKI